MRPDKRSKSGPQSPDSLLGKIIVDGLATADERAEIIRRIKQGGAFDTMVVTLEECAFDCDEIARSVEKQEARAWKAIAAKLRSALKIALEASK